MPRTVTLRCRAKKQTDSTPKSVVGWREWAGLPNLGIDEIKVKIDTGARTSAVHAFNIRRIHKDGKDWVRFDVHPIQGNDTTSKTCKAEVVDYLWVTNSGGGREKRFLIVTMLRMGADAWPIEVTLTDRDQMGFRMLLGRTAMERRLIVDPARSYCLKRPILKKGTSRPKPIHVAPPIAEDEE
nr:MAG: ATP-dependent zinc protease [Hyphomicrobiales bacterium]TFG54804.1 MAG: ATP-dependent zinc protease [Hyphomicrobiales bacterium]